MLDQHAGLVIDRAAAGHAGDELQARDRACAWSRTAEAATRLSTSPAPAIELGQHHRDGLQRLDLDAVIRPRIGMLDT
jgi:hypothetical protein